MHFSISGFVVHVKHFLVKLLMHVYTRARKRRKILHLLYHLYQTEAVGRQEVFCKKGVLKNFAKLTGKRMYQGVFLNKVAGLRPATLLKKRL